MVSEKQFQDVVLRYAVLRNYRCYHTFDSRRSNPGFPDLVLVRTMPEPQVVFAELKAQRGRLTPDQQDWGDLLSAVSEHTNGVMSYHLWRPDDWDEIEGILRGPTRAELDAAAWRAAQDLPVVR